jgi:hypothetical protein
VVAAGIDLQCGSCEGGNATVGAPYNSTLGVANDSGPYTFSIVSGSLPTGLTLNATTGLISGTPTASGTFTFTSMVKDSANRTDTQVCTIVVAPAPFDLQCGSCGVSKLNVGTHYSLAYVILGGTSPYKWTVVSSNLPWTLTLNLSSTGATITGTPTSSGTYSVTLKVVDANGNTDTQQCTIVVVGTSTSPVDLECGACGSYDTATIGSSYTESLKVSGGTAPYTYKLLSGTLPPGLGLNTSTGVVSGAPTSQATQSSYTFTVQVTDGKNNTDTATCTIKMYTPPINLQPGTCGSSKAQWGQGYSGKLQANGGTGNYNYSVSNGSLPDGFNLDSKTGTVSGTPTRQGFWVFTAKVTDSSGNSATTNCFIACF